jgi:hypothetical protein
MPLKTIDLTTAPGFLIRTCAACGIESRVAFDRGAAETKPAPLAIPVDSTLEVKVDGQAMPQTVTFAATDFPDFAAVTAVQLRDKFLAALSGATASLSLGGGVTIESGTTGPNSMIEIVGGSARAALGFPTSVIENPCPCRPRLGRELAPGFHNVNIVCFRRCHCGAHEMLVRTWDVCDPKYVGSHFYEHRRGVNALAVHFKAQGWLEPSCAAEINAEASDPPDRTPGLPGTVINMPPVIAAAPSGGDA